MDDSIAAGVWQLVEHHLAPDSTGKRRLVLHLHGPRGAGKRELALNVCERLSAVLLSVDAELLLARGPEAESLVRVAFREGLLQHAFIYLEHADALLQDAARPLLNALEVATSEYGWLVFLSGESHWARPQAFAGCSFHSTDLPVPDVPVRTAVWERCLKDEVSEAAALAYQLGGQFQLTPGQIRGAVDLARNRGLMEPERLAITASDLAAACRENSSHKLRELAVKIEPHYGWDDIVLPEDKLAHLRGSAAISGTDIAFSGTGVLARS